MHPYIPHLLTDISAAHCKEIPLKDKAPQSFEEEMEEIEKWLEGEEPDHTFGYYCGLDAINFPPAEQLKDSEIKIILKAFNTMMFTWNLDIDLPEQLPLQIAYTMTVDTLNTKTAIVSSGIMSFDFCSGYAPDCIFKAYCPCLKIWNNNDDKNDIDFPENNNPF